MTDPTSYAAGIEAAARVAENFAWVEWPSENALATCPDYRRGIADAIRALAPERGGGSEPAPPAAPSGFPGADEWDEISEADKQTLERVQETLPIEDLEALERIVEARINRALAALASLAPALDEKPS